MDARLRSGGPWVPLGRTLLVDAEPQADSTSIFLAPASVQGDLSDVIVARKEAEGQPLSGVILTGSVAKIGLGQGRP